MDSQEIDIRQLMPAGTLLQEGKYRVVRYLSSGNFGNTYIVEHTDMHMQFAMKEFFLRNICYRTDNGLKVSVSNAVNPQMVAIQREKFKKEAQRLFGLQNPHLVHVHDMFEENGTVYYVMDFVRGESLANYMERQNKPLTEEQVRYILGQLLDGLEEIHNKQIWHLDLKPDNIMIDKTGNVVIIDFGASKQMGKSGKYTGTSNILCYTPGYAPAEQMNQNMEAIGPWTDIYALGATLYNLLTNIDPSTQSTGTKTYPTAVSSQLKSLISKMTSPLLNERPQSVAALRSLMMNQTLGIGTNEKGNTSKGAKTTIIVLSIVTVLLLVARIFLLVSNRKLSKEVKSLNQTNWNLEQSVLTNSDKINSLRDSLSAAYSAYNSFKDKVKYQIPILITDIKMGSVDNYSNLETNYGSTLYSSIIHFVKPQITYQGINTDRDITIYCRLYTPSGSMLSGSSSPSGYTWSTTIPIYSGENKRELTGWGWQNSGMWSTGNYRCEIWYNNVCLKAKSFYIY